MSKNNDLENKLYDATLDELLRRVSSGEASAADMANALKFLKDHNITSDPKNNKKVGELEKAATNVLPFPTAVGE